MKKLLLILTLMISLNSYGEWTELVKSVDSGDTFYIDTDTIKEHKGYVYFWTLQDYLKPDEFGTMSAKSYSQHDCGINLNKLLSWIWYKQPMGEGNGQTITLANSDWVYPSPSSFGVILFKFACDYVD